MSEPVLSIALIEPEIPQNTGNIGRTCVATNVPLHLVKPLGYSLEDKYLKRAGLDYWPYLSLTQHENIDELRQETTGRFVLTRSWGGTPLYDFEFQPGDVLLFGRESVGLSDELFATFPDHHVTIPMVGATRSLNISNSVAIVLFEGLRQLDSQGLPVFRRGTDSVQARRECDTKGCVLRGSCQATKLPR